MATNPRTSFRGVERGCLVPAAPDVIEPLTLLSPPLFSPQSARLRVRVGRASRPPRSVEPTPRDGYRRRRSGAPFIVEDPSKDPVAVAPRSHDRHTRRWDDRRMALVTPPWASCRSRAYLRDTTRFPCALSRDLGADECRPPARARPPFTRVRPPFWGAYQSLFEARRRSTTSATQTTCEHDPESSVLAGRRPQPPSVCAPSSSRKSVDDVASRASPPCRPRHRFGPLAWDLRRRYRPDASPRSACAGRVGVTERTTRAEGPSEGRVPRKDREARWLRVGACACGATLTTFPSSAASEHSLSPVRAPPREEPTTPDGPTKTHVPKGPREGYRLPAGRSAFHRARSRARSRIAPTWKPEAASHPRRPHAPKGVLDRTLQASRRA